MPENPKPQQHWASELGALSGVGMTIGIATAAGVFGGQWADGKWGTGPWLTVAGAFAGFAAGMVNLVRVYQYFSRQLGKRPDDAE